jgi:hypothetical protein
MRRGRKCGEREKKGERERDKDEARRGAGQA